MTTEDREYRRARIAVAAAAARAAKRREHDSQVQYLGPEAWLRDLDKEIAQERAQEAQRTRSRELTQEARMRSHAATVRSRAARGGRISPGSSTRRSRTVTREFVDKVLTRHGVPAEVRARVVSQVVAAGTSGAEIDLGEGRKVKLNPEGTVSVRSPRTIGPNKVRAYVNKLK